MNFINLNNDYNSKSKVSSKIHIGKYILHISLIGLAIFLCFLLISCKKKDIRNIPVIEPLEESEIIKLSIESKFLDKDVPIIIYLPKGYGDGTEYPVWYGLHGHGNTESMWINNGITEAADELIDNGEIEPLIMVFPYVKDASLKEIEADIADDGKIDERNIDKFISKELITYIDTNYFSIISSEARFIGGFSMGGMMSLRIAFHHTDLFSKVGGYSPAILSSDYSDRQLEGWLFPNDNPDDISDLVSFAKEHGFDRLEIYMDAGKTNDPFTVGIQSLHEALQKRQIRSDFQIYDGGHSLQKDKIKDYLKFYVGIQ